MPIRIAHLTSVHTRHDVRIFHKMCRGLARRGFEAFLVVADGRGDAQVDGVNIRDAGASNGRLGRMTAAPIRVLRAAQDIDASIVHLHDPELIPIGISLKRQGNTVLFDSHEDVPLQLRAKHYLPSVLQGAAAGTYALLERLICPVFDGIVVPTPSIASKFARINPNTVLVRNYPLIDEFCVATCRSHTRSGLCYVGGITASRGIRELLTSLAITRSRVQVQLAGPIRPASFANELSAMPQWSHVRYHGSLDRSQIVDLLSSSAIGIVCLLQTPNHLAAYPVKLFEYMAAGLPVIASDFPVWREIVTEAQCGILVDPTKPEEIAAAIDRLVGDPEYARALGDNGRRAVEERLNWSREEDTLVSLYQSLLAP